MATVSKWTPFGVALDLTATGSNVKRISATQYTVDINVSWETTWDTGTDYGMNVTVGNKNDVIVSSQGVTRKSGSKTFNGSNAVIFSISGNAGASRTVTVTFRNYNTYHGDSATKKVTFNVTVPAWTSYTVSYNKNTTASVSNMPLSQTKWKDQTLTLASNIPTRTGYTFLGWAPASSATTASYAAGGKYTGNATMTLYAVWKVNTWTITYNANGGSGAPGNQTKKYDTTLTLSSTKPTRQNYTFKGWATSASATTSQYYAGGSYTANAGATLYAVWQLAYVKPQITAVTVERGSYNPETGSWETSDNGTMAMIEFDWDTFLDAESIAITLESADKEPLTYESSLSGTSGTITQYVGDSVPLSADSTYTVKITVTDANGSTTLTRTLPGMKFAIDFLAGGKGAAVGKPAELEDVFDIAFKTRMTGGLTYMPIAPGTNLNEILTPNMYIGENASTNEYVNCPITSGTFTLEVLSSGSNGQVKQILTKCDKTSGHVYERTYYSGQWQDNWYGVWYDADLGAAGKFTNYYSSGSEAPRYRRVGSLVEIRGTVKPLNEIEYSTDYTTIFTLPSGYRPDTSVFTICQGSGHTIWLMQVNTSGNVGLTRYRNGDTATTVPTTAWLPFHCTFLVG